MYELPHELPNMLRLGKLRNYNKIPEIPGFDDKYPAKYPVITYYGINSVHFRGSLTWNNSRSYIKSSRLVCEFKNNIQNFRDIDSGCFICQT